MVITRSEHIKIKGNDKIAILCHKSNNLYNGANYLIRKEYLKNKKWLRDYELKELIKNAKVYNFLPSYTSQYILKELDSAWKSYFKLLKDTNESKQKISPPGFKKKDGQYILVFSNKDCKIKENGTIQFPKKLDLKNGVKTMFATNDNLKEVKIIPKGGGYIPETKKKKTKSKGLGYVIKIIYEK